jgi:hypothetical protein
MNRPKMGKSSEIAVANMWKKMLVDRSRASRKAQYDRLSQKATTYTTRMTSSGLRIFERSGT